VRTSNYFSSHSIVFFPAIAYRQIAHFVVEHGNAGWGVFDKQLQNANGFPLLDGHFAAEPVRCGA
jgi:hypothetical protein